MKLKKAFNTRTFRIGLAVAATLGYVAAARAEDKNGQKLFPNFSEGASDLGMVPEQGLVYESKPPRP